MQWAHEIESARNSSVQCNDTEVESILLKSPEERTITIYDNKLDRMPGEQAEEEKN